MNMDVKFKGRGYFLSNFYPCKTHMWGENNSCTEAAYQYKKAIFNGDVITARKIQAARSGLQAKYLSRCIMVKRELTPSWMLQRRRIMYAVVAVQFRESHLRKRLLDTGNHRLIENVASGDG
ncbi:MAG: NADAR family protein, partial [Chromatiales bacterium]